jgi:hypothetical protein
MDHNTQSLIYNTQNADYCLKYFHKRLMFFVIIHANIKLQVLKSIQHEVISIRTVLEPILMKHRCIVIGIFLKERMNHSQEKPLKNLVKV